MASAESGVVSGAETPAGSRGTAPEYEGFFVHLYTEEWPKVKYLNDSSPHTRGRLTGAATTSP